MCHSKLCSKPKEALIFCSEATCVSLSTYFHYVTTGDLCPGITMLSSILKNESWCFFAINNSSHLFGQRRLLSECRPIRKGPDSPPRDGSDNPSPGHDERSLGAGPQAADDQGRASPSASAQWVSTEWEARWPWDQRDGNADVDSAMRTQPKCDLSQPRLRPLN